jgi:hypothetical protein
MAFFGNFALANRPPKPFFGRGGQACRIISARYKLLALISFKMGLHWRANPVGKVRLNLPFLKKFTQKLTLPIDLNPLAVLAAKASIIVVLANRLRPDQPPITLPVYLADAINCASPSDGGFFCSRPANGIRQQKL